MKDTEDREDYRDICYKDTAESEGHRDKGYSWVILSCVFVIAFFHLGIIKVFGVFVPVLVEQLDLNMWAIGFCVSVGIAANSLLGPVWTAASRLASYRTLTIIGGLLSSIGVILVSLSDSMPHLAVCMMVISIGSGLPLVGKIVALKDYFETKFSFANGVAFTGGALGTMLLAPLLEFLTEVYGWRGALVIFSAMNFNVCAAGLLMRSPQDLGLVDASKLYSKVDSKSYAEDGNSSHVIKKEEEADLAKLTGMCAKGLDTFLNYFGFSVLIEYPFITMYLTSIALHEMVVGGWVLYLVPYACDIGFTAQTASFLTGLGGAGALLGRLAVGPFVDEGLISGRMMYFCLTAGGSVMMFCYPFTGIYWILCVLSVMTGFLLASTTPIFIVMLKELLPDGSGYFAGAVGLHYMTRGMGTLIGTQLTGWLYDHTGSFYLSFITLAVLDICAAAMSLVKSTYLPNSE